MDWETNNYVGARQHQNRTCGEIITHDGQCCDDCRDGMKRRRGRPITRWLETLKNIRAPCINRMGWVQDSQMGRSYSRRGSDKLVGTRWRGDVKYRDDS